MTQIGKWNDLKVLSIEDFGVYLDAGALGKALYRPVNEESVKVGTSVKVFLYFDKGNNLIGTTKEPKIEVGKVAILKVVDVNATGAFVDWGLDKNLMVPFAQQSSKMIKGLSYPIYCYQDKYDQRLLGSAKLSKHLQETSKSLRSKQKVQLLICGKTSLGYKAVINDKYLGLIHSSDAYKKLNIGEQTEGYIKNVRDDGKINLMIQLTNKKGLDDLADRILADLEKHKTSKLTDKSSPQDIYEKWNVSKASYKKAIGRLYKEKKINLLKDQIELLE